MARYESRTLAKESYEPQLIYNPRIVSPQKHERQHRNAIKTLIGAAILLTLGVALHEIRGTLQETHASSANQTIAHDAPDNTRMPKGL